MSGFISDSPLARGLIRIGDETIPQEDDAKLRRQHIWLPSLPTLPSAT